MKILLFIVTALLLSTAYARWDSATLVTAEKVGTYGIDSIFICHYKVDLQDYSFRIRRVGLAEFRACPRFVKYNVETNEVLFD